HRRMTVELGDGSVGLLPEEWLERWGLLAQVVGDKSKELKLSSRQVGLLDLVLTSLPVEGSDETLERLRERVDRFAHVEPAQPPESFHGELRPYQEHGLGWLRAMAELGFGACLADDMGLGKTVQVLAHLAQVHGKGAKPQGPTLVVVPRSLVNNWLDEARRFAPDLRVHVHWGAERTSPNEWPQADLVITTYALLRLDLEALAKREFECVVLDEAQAIKNATSATAKAAKLLRGRQRLALTGTPIENHLGELWSLFDFLNPELLGELPVIKRLVAKAKPSVEGYELIRRVVRPFVLRRTKGEVARDLPERIEQTLYVELDDGERSAYDELFAHYRARVAKQLTEQGPEQSTPHVLEALLRLRQAACHPGLIDEARRSENSSKVTALLEQLNNLREEGHKALVFSQFTSLLGIVRSKLDEEGIRYEYLDGGTRDRAERVARVQSDPDTPVF
ncbi:MAG TPA: DEAD/DEAH box helicase, partial [Polyangiaceae bacterium]|nr:DEAD/DEAH box helicase [Polyangiaceae bacterium]